MLSSCFKSKLSALDKCIYSLLTKPEDFMAGSSEKVIEDGIVPSNI